MKHEPEAYQDARKLEARYANYFEIAHMLCEFHIDFGQIFSEETEPRFHTRIFTSPLYAKTLFETLQQAITQYEKRFGVISNREK